MIMHGDICSCIMVYNFIHQYTIIWIIQSRKIYMKIRNHIKLYIICDDTSMATVQRSADLGRNTVRGIYDGAPRARMRELIRETRKRARAHFSLDRRAVRTREKESDRVRECKWEADNRARTLWESDSGGLGRSCCARAERHDIPKTPSERRSNTCEGKRVAYRRYRGCVSDRERVWTRILEY